MAARQRHHSQHRGRPEGTRPETGRQRNREQFFAQMNAHLGRLYRFVRHELAYHQAVGDLLPGELTVDDVVDAVLLDAYREFVRNPDARPLRRGRLMRLAVERLETEVRRLRLERARTPVRLEEDAPEMPPTEQVQMLGEEILYFYEPDEDLKVEDIIPDLDVESPEQHAEAVELRVCVNAALSRMPPLWRRALLFRHVDGLDNAELADALGTSEADAERIVSAARADLRRALVESGCVLNRRDAP